MKVTELRVDNFILYKSPFGNNEEKIGQMKPGDFSSFDERSYFPIPLTPEWLERCGLSISDKPEADVYKVYSNLLIDIAYKEDGYYLYSLCADPYYDQSIGKPIKYVHQLQNLYYALTGTELTINF